MNFATQLFAPKLTKSDVELAVAAVIESDRPTMFYVTRRLGWGVNKASRALKLLESAGVITKAGDANGRRIILKSQAAATNAALRQLKRGKR